MKRLWIQYIVLILCVGCLLAVFPAFTDSIRLAEAEVDWQQDSYINQFGDSVLPLPLDEPDDITPASSDTASVSSEEPSSTPASSQARSSSALPPASSKPPVSSAAPASSKPPVSSAPPLTSGGETVRILENGRAVSYPLAELLPQIVEAELSSSAPVEAIKAQAIAAHTCLRYYNDIEDKALAVAKRTPGSRVKQACAEVLDKIITINGKPVYTPYCAATAGRTNSAADVWSSPLSHLQSVESIYDSEDGKNWDSKQTMSVDKVKEAIQKNTGITVTGNPDTWLTCIDKTVGGYNKSMTICGKSSCQNGKAITGRFIRENVLGLKSAWFTWEIGNGSFIFTTRGYGHGAGMSQMGAVGYANHGWTYTQILTHYYTGVTITKT